MELKTEYCMYIGLKLVSLDQAKGLREFGFPQGLEYSDCSKSYYKEFDDTYAVLGDIELKLDEESYKKVISAPVLYEAAKWLSMVKDFDIETHREGDAYTVMYTWFDERIGGYNVEYLDEEDGCKSKEYPDRESAISAGIDRALEILEKNKNNEN